MLGGEHSHWRNAFATGVDDCVAAWCKRAPRWTVKDTDCGAGDLLEPPALGCHLRDRPQQAGRVRMARVSEQRRSRCMLDDVAAVHDRHVIGDGGDHSQIVRDVNERCTAFPLEGSNGVENAVLNLHVEAGGRLVQHDDVGIDSEGKGEGDALDLAAAELMRIAAKHGLVRWQLDLVQIGGDALPSSIPAEAVDEQRFHKLVADRHRRIERRGRVLADIGRQSRACATELVGGQRGEIDIPDQRSALDQATARPCVAEDGHRRCRLAAAGLADEAKQLAGPHIEADFRDDRESGGDMVDPYAVHDQATLVHRHGIARLERSALDRPLASVTRLTPMLSTASVIAGKTVGQRLS